jgi:septal ring factor EnvC (AmiA/AmiB activator)
MMKEIFEKELNEQLGTVQAADLDKSKKAEEAMSPADKRSMDAYQNALQKITDDVRKIDAEISKLQEPVRAKVSRLESKKATIQKKQGQLVTKIDYIKKKNM